MVCRTLVVPLSMQLWLIASPGGRPGEAISAPPRLYAAQENSLRLMAVCPAICPHSQSPR